jgi:hypothetical protein
MDHKPVFVSTSGRHRPALRWSGIALAILLGGYLVVVGTALLTTVDTPRAELPGRTATGGDDQRERRETPRPRGTTR